MSYLIVLFIYLCLPIEGQLMAQNAPSGAKDLSSSAVEKPRTEPAHSSLRLVRRFVGHRHMIQHVSVSKDGRRALSCDAAEPETLRMWDVDSGKELRQFEGAELTPTAALFSPDGRFVLSSNSDMNVRLWEADTGHLVRTFADHASSIYNIAFFPDGTRFVSVGEDRTTRVWDIKSGRILVRFQRHKDDVSGAVVSPDGKWVITADNSSIIKWDPNTAAVIERIDKIVKGGSMLALFPDGQHFLSAGSNGIMLLQDLKTREEIWREAGRRVDGVALSADGGRLAYVTGEGSLVLCDAKTGKEIARVNAYREVAKCVAFLPDGKHILSGGWDGPGHDELRLWALPG